MEKNSGFVLHTVAHTNGSPQLLVLSERTQCGWSAWIRSGPGASRVSPPATRSHRILRQMDVRDKSTSPGKRSIWRAGFECLFLRHIEGFRL